MNLFAQRLREFRNEVGLSQRKFGEYLGLKSTSYPNYEKGLAYPCIADLRKIAVRLDISLDYLLGRIDEKKSLSSRFDKEVVPFKERVRQLRLEKQMTQVDMVEGMGLLSRFSCIHYERGTREPNAERLIALADLFGVSLDYLVGFVEK